MVSDYWTIPFLADKHRVARDAALFALDAGIDVELPESVGYGAALAAAGREGRMPEAVLDRAVLRHLETKAMAGLLDAGRALVPDAAESTDLDSAEHRDLARRLASESTIMLRDGMPDLAGSARIAVIGPCADEIRSLMGCYAFPNHVLTHHPELDPGIPIRTVLDALGDEFPRSSVVHARGADVLAPADPDEIARAVEVAVSSDAVVLVVGDVSGLFGTGSSGEGCDVGDLRLPGGQHELVQEILALGIPTVLVVVSGRPYALGDYDAASAVVQSFTPGVEGRR